MKKLFLFSIVLVFAVSIQFAGASNGRAGENKGAINASKCAVDHIIQYYASMVKLKKKADPSYTTYKSRLVFFQKNRTKLISKIAQADRAGNLGLAYQVCDNFYKNSSRYLGYTPPDSGVSRSAYFDAQTGHRYIRQNYGTYAEFTKTGEFFKLVPADLFLLRQSPRVYPMTENNYILYERYSDGETAYKSLPAGEPHPKGWKARKLLSILN